MVRASRGLLHRTRRKMKKAHRAKFKAETFLQEYKEGDKVVIKIDPSKKDNAPHPIYLGRNGVIKERKGTTYTVSLNLGKRERLIHTKPEHLKKME